jgi:hypothetical protein
MEASLAAKMAGRKVGLKAVTMVDQLVDTKVVK